MKTILDRLQAMERLMPSLVTYISRWHKDRCGGFESL